MQATTQLALASKYVTTPIALAITEILGGQQPLAATFVMLTGLTGALISPPLLSRMGFDDHRRQGVAWGSAPMHQAPKKLFKSVLYVEHLLPLPCP